MPMPMPSVTLAPRGPQGEALPGRHPQCSARGRSEVSLHCRGCGGGAPFADWKEERGLLLYVMYMYYFGRELMRTQKNTT